MQSTSSLDRERWLLTLDAGIAADPDLLTLRLERAMTLESLGRDEEAEAAYRDVHTRDPDDFTALTNLALLTYRTGNRLEAFTLFKETVARHPYNDKAHANFGFMLLRADDPASARLHYERALKLEPENVEAHRGLAIALQSLGETAAAAEHHALGFDNNPLTVLPFRGEGDGIRTLVIVSSTSGNIHFEPLLDDTIFAITKIVAESAACVHQLPPHDLLINAIGDADVAAEGLAGAHRIVLHSDAKVVNHPAIVERTRRVDVAERLRGIPNVRTAQMRIYPRRVLLSTEGPNALTATGFTFPLLIRALGYHTGEHFARIESADHLAATVGEMPGDELLVIEYIDTRGSNGMYCKYRVMMIDGEIYPLHAATSADWKVHYFSAQMDDAANLRTDKAFLQDINRLLPSCAIWTLADIAAELELDYGGIDFSVTDNGGVVVFEANATMVIVQPAADERCAYRVEPVRRVGGAVQRLLLSRTKNERIYV